MTDEDLLTQQVRELAAGYHVPPPVPADAMWARIAGTVDQTVAAYAVAQAPVRSRSSWWRSTPVMSAAMLAGVLVIGVAIGRWTAPVGRTQQGVSAPSPQVASSSVPSVAPVQEVPESSAQSTLQSTMRRVLPNGIAQMNPHEPPARHQSTGYARTDVAALPRSDNASATTADATTGSVAASTTQASVLTVASQTAKDPGSVYTVTTDQHLVSAEALLTAFRTDAKAGRVDPRLSHWARDLLATTRILYDASSTSDPQLQKLLADLELVLVQVATYQPNKKGEARLAQRAVDQSHILPRLREVTNL